jgi:hypothetical protein
MRFAKAARSAWNYEGGPARDQERRPELEHPITVEAAIVCGIRIGAFRKPACPRADVAEKDHRHPTQKHPHDALHPGGLPARRGGALKENKLLSRHISQNMNTSVS